MEIFSLTNGLKVICLWGPGPVCHCGLVINAGSRDEQANEHGLAHFVEHTIFKGTERHTSHYILNRLDEVGGELNAYTTKDETAIHASFLEEHLGRAAELIADMAFHSTFPQKELDKERDVIIDEITSYQDTPSEMIFDEFEDMAFAGTPLGHNILGTAESVSGFTGADAKRFIERTHCVDQMAFVYIGPDKPAKVVKIAERHFGSCAAKQKSEPRESVATFAHFDETKERNTHQGHVVMGYRAPDCHDEDKLSMAVISNLLGGPSLNSRLSVALRERNGIAYNVETNYTSFDDTGLFTIYFGTDTQNIARSGAIVKREIDRLCQSAMSETAFAKVLRQYTGQLLMSVADTESLMLDAARAVVIYGQSLSVYEMAAVVHDRVTPQSLLRVAQKVFDEANMSRLIYV